MTTSVQQALTAIIAELPAITKGDKSPQGYTYRGIEAITKQLQPLLAKHGVVIVPSATISNVTPSPGMKESWQDVYMTVQWDVYGPDGSKVTACTTGIGRDNADKGANKAQTQAFKYLLLHLLCIADAKDDADSHTYDAGRREADPVRDLYDRIAKAGGGDKQLAAAIKAECEQWGCKFTLPAFRDGGEKLHKALERLVEEWPHMVDAAVDERTVA